MVKIKLYGTLIVATLLLSGCFSQDYSDCTIPDNLILKLNLTEGGAIGSLNEKVSRADIFIYDMNYQQIAHRQVEKERKEEFPAQTFTVEPGEYHIVCWGNIGEETKIVGLEEVLPLSECYLETISDITGSPLYYASDVPVRSPYTVTVLPNQEVTKEITFIRAHRTIKVYTRGYEKIHEEASPKIRLTGMPASSDFLLRTGSKRKTHESVSTRVKTESGDRMMVSFNTLIAPIDDDMSVEVVKSSNNEIITTINLKQYVEDKILEIDDLNELNIEVYYLMDGSVEISVIDWEDIPLEPEW